MSKNIELCRVGASRARRTLSRLLAQVEAGGEVEISRRGKPVAKLVGVESKVRPKRFGLLEGRIFIPHDFDAPLSPDTLLGG
jgi:prevent-host-death family protein